MRYAASIAAVLLCTALPAQKLEWKLQRDAFAAYAKERHELEFRHDHRILRMGPDPVPGFFAYELEDGRRVSWSGPSLLDLPPMLALSLGPARLRQKDRRKRHFDNVQKFGRVLVTGSFLTTADEDATRIEQEGSFELRCVEADWDGLRRDLWEQRRIEGELTLHGCSLEIRRTLDLESGRVTRFEFTLKGALQPKAKLDDEGDARSFRLSEAWRFDRFKQPGYDGFRREVNEAIARAQSHLTSKLEAWLEGHEMRKGEDQSGNTYGTGRLALVLLAIQKGEPDHDLPGMKRAFAELRRREPRDTYSLASSILALETLYENANEIQQLRDGLLQAPARRHPGDEDRALLQEWTRRLLGNYDSSVDRGYLLRFHYTQGPHYDNSNTQYAALGLAAAERCGIEVPTSAWLGLAAHWQKELRVEEARPRPLRLVTYAERRARDAQARTGSRRRGRRIAPQGFGYRLEGVPYGSMTCAGITGLQLTLGALLAPGRRAPRKLIGELEAARHAGFAWLAENWNLRNNPRKHRDYYYYWLYSLERSFELGGIAALDERDWYFEGALQLLWIQQRSGAWGRLEDTAFALLFLKKASAPAVTENR